MVLSTQECDSPRDDVHIFGFIPQNIYVLSREGRRLVELFYSQDLWDFGMGKSVPEVAILVHKVIFSALKRCGVISGQSDTPLATFPDIPQHIKYETIQLIRREGHDHAFMASKRFESGKVRAAVYGQEFRAYYNWMVPVV